MFFFLPLSGLLCQSTLRTVEAQLARARGAQQEELLSQVGALHDPGVCNSNVCFFVRYVDLLLSPTLHSIFFC